MKVIKNSFKVLFILTLMISLTIISCRRDRSAKNATQEMDTVEATPGATDYDTTGTTGADTTGTVGIADDRAQ